MFSRASQPSSSSNALPGQAFQDDAEDLFAENLVSGQRLSRLLDKASRAGIQGTPATVRKTIGKNQARDISRSKLRLSKWPPYYWFDCRVKDRKSGDEYTTQVPILLPLELLEVLWDLGLKEALLSEANLDSESKKHLQWMKEQLSEEDLWAFGIHGDGIPCNYDRTESVQMLSLNFPGLSGRNGRIRIPMVLLPDRAVGPNTWDDIMSVIAWSMRHLLIGSRPTCRHDGSPWWQSDAKRSKKTGNLKFKACLVQVRGDWDWFGKCFHFPFHNVKAGCCWLCKCLRSEVHICVCVCVQEPVVNQHGG